MKYTILVFQMKDLHEIIISRKTTEPKEERGKMKLSTGHLERQAEFHASTQDEA